MQSDLSSNTAIAASLQRLSEKLHTLLHSIAGEDPPESHADGEKPPDQDDLLRLLDGHEDWALERESEIARLERENEELRKLLGIDRGNVEAKGWLEDEARELAQSVYVPIPRTEPQGAQPPLGPNPSVSPFLSLQNVGMPQPPRPIEPGPMNMRMIQGRRPATFGQRGRGGGPGGGWEGVMHPPPWQAQVGLDLS